MECGLPEAKAKLRGLPAANKWVCPMTSSIDFGRSASAKGGGGVLSKRPLIPLSLDEKNHDGSPSETRSRNIR